MNVVKLSFGNKERDCWEFTVEGKDYEFCEEVAQNMWANKKTGAYGKGIINSESDPYRVERTGRLGEFAFAQIFDLKVDTEYKHGGDICDFTLGKYKVDIKTASSNKYKEGLIRAFTEKGNPCKIKSDIFVFATLQEDREKKIGVVTFLGFYYKTDLSNDLLAPAKVGRHMNFEIPHEALLPMEKLCYI